MSNKAKPRKAATKRIKVTGSGKLARRKAGLTHLQTKRSSKTQQKNNGDGALAVANSDVKASLRLLVK